MSRLILAGAMLGATTLLLGVAPARADFFSLDGRFQCLDSKAAVCGDADPLVHAMPPVSPAVTQPMPAASAVAVVPPAVTRAEPPGPVDDPLSMIAKRVQTGAVTGGDIVWLKQAAHAQNARAVELLGWCELHGVGVPSDPIQAYILYGIAASNGLPHARDNQVLVYEQALSPEQRQQLLDLTNNGLSGSSVAYAR